MLAFFAALVLAQVSSTASPAPTPAATASPIPIVSAAPEFTLYGFSQPGTTATTEISNALLNVTIDAQKLRANATAGDYAFPTVGFPLLPTTRPAQMRRYIARCRWPRSLTASIRI